MKFIKWLVVVLLVPCIITMAQDVPDDLQAKFILKIVTYDKNFDRFSSPIKIGITNNKFLMTLRKMKSIKIKGSPFKAEALNSPSEVVNFDVIYIDKNSLSNAAGFAEAASAEGVLSFSESVDGLDNGLAVSFYLKDGKPKIVINLKNSGAQGTAFAGNFLGVCDVR